MENRSLSVVAGLIGSLLALTAHADEADWQARLARAKQMQTEAQQQRKAADADLAVREQACHEKFAVNDCLNDARRAHREVARGAQLLENDGKTIERQVRKEQLRDKEAQRAREAPQRDAERAAKGEAAAAEQAATQQRIADKQAEKAAQAKSGAARRARDAERQRQKQEKHQQEVAKRKAKAERRAAEGGS